MLYDIILNIFKINGFIIMQNSLTKKVNEKYHHEQNKNNSSIANIFFAHIQYEQSE